MYDIQRFFFACSFARALTFARESITLKRGPNPVRRKEIIIHGDFGQSLLVFAMVANLFRLDSKKCLHDVSFYQI